MIAYLLGFSLRHARCLTVYAGRGQLCCFCCFHLDLSFVSAPTFFALAPEFSFCDVAQLAPIVRCALSCVHKGTPPHHTEAGVVLIFLLIEIGNGGLSI